jgi:hypothetical protein
MRKATRKILCMAPWSDIPLDKWLQFIPALIHGCEIYPLSFVFVTNVFGHISNVPEHVRNTRAWSLHIGIDWLFASAGLPNRRLWEIGRFWENLTDRVNEGVDTHLITLRVRPSIECVRWKYAVVARACEDESVLTDSNHTYGAPVVVHLEYAKFAAVISLW